MCPPTTSPRARGQADMYTKTGRSPEPFYAFCAGIRARCLSFSFLLKHATSYFYLMLCIFFFTGIRARIVILAATLRPTKLHRSALQEVRLHHELEEREQRLPDRAVFVLGLVCISLSLYLSLSIYISLSLYIYIYIHTCIGMRSAAARVCVCVCIMRNAQCVCAITCACACACV